MCVDKPSTDCLKIIYVSRWERERERESTSLMIYVFIIFQFLSVLTSGKYDVIIWKDEI